MFIYHRITLKHEFNVRL